jgi:IS5 family transposase
MLTAANDHLKSKGIKIETGMIMDATLISAPSPVAQDMIRRRGSRGHPLSDGERAKNATESRVRAKGEHPFLVIKLIFGFTHVRYRGLAKNGTRFEVLYALAKLYLKWRVLMRFCHA